MNNMPTGERPMESRRPGTEKMTENMATVAMSAMTVSRMTTMSADETTDSLRRMYEP